MEDILLFLIFLFITFIIFIIIYFIYNYNNLYLIDKFTNNNCNNFIKHENSYCYPGVKGTLMEKNQLNEKCKSKNKCKGYILYNKGNNINKGYLCRDNWSGTLNNYDKTDTYECQTNCECPEGYIEIKCDRKTGIAICKAPVDVETDNKIKDLENIINTNKTNLKNIINTNKTDLESEIVKLKENIKKNKKIYKSKSIKYILKKIKKDGDDIRKIVEYLDSVEIDGKIYKLEDLEYINNSFFNKFKENIVSERKNTEHLNNGGSTTFKILKPYYTEFINKTGIKHNLLTRSPNYVGAWFSINYRGSKINQYILKYLLSMSLLETEKITVNIDDLNNIYETDDLKIKKIKISYYSNIKGGVYNNFDLRNNKTTIIITFYSNKNYKDGEWYFVITEIHNDFNYKKTSNYIDENNYYFNIINKNVKEEDMWYVTKIYNMEYINDIHNRSRYELKISTSLGKDGIDFNKVGIKITHNQLVDNIKRNSTARTKYIINKNKYYNGTEIIIINYQNIWTSIYYKENIVFKFCNNKFIISAIDENFIDPELLRYYKNKPYSDSFFDNNFNLIVEEI